MLLREKTELFVVSEPQTVLTVTDDPKPYPSDLPPDDLEEEDVDEAELLAQLNTDAEVGEEAAQMSSIYQEATDLLVARGIPRHEIAWAQDARTPAEREALFAKMRKGEIRVMITSTHRMGVGVNVQERLYAMHHLTTPWRPCDVKQADGRGWRPGNIFPEIWIKRYITSPSFDGFSWQGIETKGRFEDAFLRGDPTVRVMSDIDEQIISAGEIKALASGDPRIVQKVRLEHELNRLKQTKNGWEIGRRTIRDRIVRTELSLGELRTNLAIYRHWQAKRTSEVSLVCFETTHDLTEPKGWRAIGKIIRDQLIAWGQQADSNTIKREGRVMTPVGVYCGLPLVARVESDSNGKKKLPTMLLAVAGEHSGFFRLSEVSITIGDISDVVKRMQHAAADLDKRIEHANAEEARLIADAQQLRDQLETPWEHAHQFRMMELALRYLNAVLNDRDAETEAVINEVLALAESEGLDIREIIARGTAINETGPDVSQIQVRFPPLPEGVAAPTAFTAAAQQRTIETHPQAPVEPQAPEAPVISMSIFADPLPISRPTIEVASLDLTDFATEVARKKAELAQRKRKAQMDNGQMSFFA